MFILQWFSRPCLWEQIFYHCCLVVYSTTHGIIMALQWNYCLQFSYINYSKQILNDTSFVYKFTCKCEFNTDDIIYVLHCRNLSNYCILWLRFCYHISVCSVLSLIYGSGFSWKLERITEVKYIGGKFNGIHFETLQILTSFRNNIHSTNMIFTN